MALPPSPSSNLSYIDILNRCDNFHLPVPTPYSPNDPKPSHIPFLLTPSTQTPLGLVLPRVFNSLAASPQFVAEPPSHAHPRGFVSFAPGITTPAARTRAMQTLLTFWKAVTAFSAVIGPGKWRDELYDVYCTPFGILSGAGADGDDATEGKKAPDHNYAFSMERSACALFGVVTYGVHMTVYEQDDHGAVRIWVPKRASTKQTWPGFLDNSVAGGIPSTHTPFSALVKEAAEEASLPEALTSLRARSRGSVSYFYEAEGGWLQPEVEYVYDLQLRPGEIDGGLRPGDNEVESFQLLPLDKVIAHMRAGAFKPNCAVVIIDFLIRHGCITPENEPHFLEINTRLHGRFDLDRW